MMRSLCLLSFALLGACGANFETASDTNDTGGRPGSGASSGDGGTTGGTDSGTGGAPSSTGGTATGGAPSGGAGNDCLALNEARRTTLEEARSCVVGGILPECEEGWTVPNECGCPVLVNDNNPDAVQAAQNAHAAWSASCTPPTSCGVVACAIPVSGTCKYLQGEDGPAQCVP